MDKDRIKNMTKEQFTEFAETVIAPEKNLHLIPGLVVRFPTDLRSSMDEKISNASHKYMWTTYVNNAGTLAHVVCPESDILVRLVFRYPVKHLSPKRMKEAVMIRVKRFIVV